MKRSNEIVIGVVGLWHLGSVVSSSWSSKGIKTIGYDQESILVDNIQKCKPPVYEPGLIELIKKGKKNNLLEFTKEIKDLKDCNFIFLTYDTPVDNNDKSNTKILFNSVKNLLKVMRRDFILIISSQTPIGTCKKIRDIIKAQKKKSDVSYVPENLRLGDAINCYLHPDRNIIGVSSDLTKRKVLSLFTKLTKDNYIMSLESAELVKHGINSFLGLSVVFSNILSNISEETKANIIDVVKGIQSDERIGKNSYLNPGIGFSGGTLGRDFKNLEYIEKVMKLYNHNFFKLIYEQNLKRKNEIIKKIKKLIRDNKINKLSFFGITYKKNTSTLRRSVPLEIVEHFSKNYLVKIHDPQADWKSVKIGKSITICPNIKEACKSAEMIIVLTGWDQYKKFDWKTVKRQINNNIFFDVQNSIDENKIIKKGFRYYGIGK